MPPHISPSQPNLLKELIQVLYQAFETDEFNIDYIYMILENYKSNIKELAPYLKFQQNTYTRNLVDAGNGKFNLMLVCWSEGQGSSIHNHDSSHCFMKCIQGKLIETKYAWPKNEIHDEPMKIIHRRELQEGEVTYINDSIGLHRIENPSHKSPAVTLHLYVPPYNYCNVFDEQNGHTNKTAVTFYSIEGELT